jgi:hypothetical protein
MEWEKEGICIALAFTLHIIVVFGYWKKLLVINTDMQM